MRTELKMADPCSGCGTCCTKIGMPPFLVSNPLLPADPPYGSVAGWSCEHTFTRDMDIFASMPPDLLREHADLVLGMTGDPTGQPCIWLDPETKACRHYEHRPTSCRVWPVLGHGCLAAKRGAIVQNWDTNECDPHHWRNPLRSKRHPDNPNYQRFEEAEATAKTLFAEPTCS